MKPKGTGNATATRTTNLLIVRPNNHVISDESMEKVRIEAEAAEAEAKAAQEKAVAEAKAKAAQEKAQTTRLPIDLISDRAEKLHLLQVRRQEIKDKKKQVESFAISHDRNNARLTLVDANRREITTSNQNSIKKVLEDWAMDLDKRLEETENEMRTEFDIRA
jgi:hypothetical protein